jgi:hypothetical protein
MPQSTGTSSAANLQEALDKALKQVRTMRNCQRRHPEGPRFHRRAEGSPAPEECRPTADGSAALDWRRPYYRHAA